MDGFTSSYLFRPIRTEAVVAAERAAIEDRAALYERMLGYDEARAMYVAKQDWHARYGHWLGVLRQAQPGYQPVPSEIGAWLGAQLHADVTAAFWTAYVDTLVDLRVILDELADEAPVDCAGAMAMERDNMRHALSLARHLAESLKIEHERRKAGRAA